MSQFQAEIWEGLPVSAAKKLASLQDALLSLSRYHKAQPKKHNKNQNGHLSNELVCQDHLSDVL